MFVFALCLIGSVSACGYIEGAFDDSISARNDYISEVINDDGNIIGVTINEGVSVNFNYDFHSFDSSMIININLHNSLTGEIIIPFTQTVTTPCTQNGKPISGTACYTGEKTIPSNISAGNYELIMSADNIGTSKTLDLIVTVSEEPNNPPFLDYIEPQSTNENELLEFNISATDTDEDTLTYSASGLPNGANFTDNSDGTATFSWTPNYTQSGIYYVTFNVSDGKCGSDSEKITITVNNVNRAPSIASILDRTINEGETYNYQVTATDADEDTLTYSLTENLTWLSIDTSGLITGTAPEVDDDIDYLVTIQVSDGNDGFATQTYTLTVLNVVTENNDPIITSLPVIEVNENQAYNYNVIATDVDGDILTYSLTENPPTWLSINSNTGVITGTAPSVNQDRTYTISIEVSDGNEGSDTQTYTLTVKNVEEDKDKKKKTTTDYYQSNYDEQLYLNQFKSSKIIYLEDDEQPEKVLNCWQKFIEWLKKIFGFN